MFGLLRVRSFALISIVFYLAAATQSAAETLNFQDIDGIQGSETLVPSDVWNNGSKIIPNFGGIVGLSATVSSPSPSQNFVDVFGFGNTRQPNFHLGGENTYLLTANEETSTQVTFEFSSPTSGSIGFLTSFGDGTPAAREQLAISVTGAGATISDTSGEGTTSGSTVSYDSDTLGGVTSVVNLLSYADVTTFTITYTCPNAGRICGSLFEDWVVDEVLLTSATPADNSTGVATTDNIVLTFNENIAAGTGNIVISGGAEGTRTIPVGDPQITISNATLTINPTADLTASTAYSVQVDATAVDDLVGNSFAGIADTTTLNFTTKSGPNFTFNPADAENGVAADSNITITASEAIRETDDSTLDDSNVDALITLKDTNASGTAISFDATISGNVITINPTSDFSSLQQVYVAITGTDVEDTSDNAGSDVSATFTVADGAAPTFTFNPADADTGVAADSNITITASEAIRETDDTALDDTNVDALITLKETDSSGANIAFDATISGNVITINPDSNFSSLQQVYVAITGTDVEDTSNNAGSDASATFTVADSAAPTLSSSSPSDNTAGVAADANIVLTFSEHIQAGTGDIVISDGAGNTLTIPIGDGQVTIATNTVTINPTSDLSYSTGYNIQIASGVIDDTAGNAYAGITDATTLNFETAAAPTPPAPPADTTRPTVILSTTANSITNEAFEVTATFSEAVTGFELDDLTISNGSASGITAVSASVYRLKVTPVEDGAVTVDVAENVAKDSSNNQNRAATQLSLTIDTVLPTVELTGPASATAPFSVTIAFSELVTGFVQGDITITGGTVTALTGSDDSYTASVTPTADEIVKISVASGVATDAAGNDNTASNELVIAPSTPALEFAKHEAEIRQTIVSDAQRNLRSTIGSARNLTSNARQRFIAATTEQTDCTEYPQEDVEQLEDVQCGQESIPLDVDGTAQYSAGVASSAGTFLEVRESEDGNHRRLFFGDFNVQRDADASVTATLNAKMAWEQMLSDQTLYGYFIGGQFAQSDIEGTLIGDNQRVGLEAGAYAVHKLGEALYLDGFASLGLSNNTLELADDVLTLNSDYVTKTFALGAALSGIVTKASYELRPELAFNFGKAWIGDVDFTGTAYGITDDTLSLDAGNATLASLTFRPEVVLPLDRRDASKSNTQISFSPRFVCEQVKTTTRSDYCGAGAELGLSSVSKSGLSTADINLVMDRINNGTRSSVQFGIEHRF